MRVLATASAGLNRILASECAELDLRPRRVPAHGVELDLTWGEVARGLVHLRVAQRLLIYLTRFPCDGSESLYEGARAVPWEDWIDAKQTLAVASTGPLPGAKRVGRPDRGGRGRRAAPLTHHVFASQRVKDAIVDRLRDRFGSRPDVDLRAPDLRVVARFHGDACSLWLDPCGEALHRRGYRVEAGEAPLRETLAAGVMRATGWRGETPLHDPMCGSGTLLIEGVGVALGLAANPTRSFGAERWRHGGAILSELIAKERAEAQQTRTQVLKKARLEIVASDIDPAALAMTRANCERAGLADFVNPRRLDASRLTPPSAGTVLVANPPYGLRLGGDDVEDLYRAMGKNWKRFQGCEAHILDGHEGFEEAFGLRSNGALELTNGSLPVTLRRYKLGAKN